MVIYKICPIGTDRNRYLALPPVRNGGIHALFQNIAWLNSFATSGPEVSSENVSFVVLKFQKIFNFDFKRAHFAPFGVPPGKLEWQKGHRKTLVSIFFR